MPSVLAILLFALTLVSCGQVDLSSITSTAQNNQTGSQNTTTLSGTVADGYLDNAIVCLDKNRNGQCDTNEPQTRSVKGSFSLSVNSADINNYPVVVEIIAGETQDEDKTGTEPESYTLQAPADAQGFVSPITTLVKYEIDKNPLLNAEDAKKIVAEKLNITEDSDNIAKDYIQGETHGQSPAEKETFRKLHNVAKKIVDLHKRLKKKIKSSLSRSVAKKEAINRLVNSIVVANVDAIAAEIKNNQDPATRIQAIVQNAPLLNDDDIDDEDDEHRLTIQAQVKPVELIKNKQLFLLKTVVSGVVNTLGVVAHNYQPNALLEGASNLDVSATSLASSSLKTVTDRNFLFDKVDNVLKEIGGTDACAANTHPKYIQFDKMLQVPLDGKLTLKSLLKMLRKYRTLAATPVIVSRLNKKVEFDKEQDILFSLSGSCYSSSGMLGAKKITRYYLNKTAMDKLIALLTS